MPCIQANICSGLCRNLKSSRYMLCSVYLQSMYLLKSDTTAMSFEIDGEKTE